MIWLIVRHKAFKQARLVNNSVFSAQVVILAQMNTYSLQNLMRH